MIIKKSLSLLLLLVSLCIILSAYENQKEDPVIKTTLNIIELTDLYSLYSQSSEIHLVKALHISSA